MKRLLLLMLTVFVLQGCVNPIDKNESNSNEQTEPSYDDFVDFVHTFRDEFQPEGFVIASPEGPLLKHFVTFPNDLKFEKRASDALKKDINRPSKYALHYINDARTALLKVTFIYEQINTDGIIFRSITSPVDNMTLDELYHDVNRPYMINTLLSTGTYLVNFEHYIIEPDRVDGIDDEKIKWLIDADSNFYKQAEEFLSN